MLVCESLWLYVVHSLADARSAALLLLAYGCSASNDDNAGQAGGGGSGGIAEAGSDEAHFGTDGSPPDQDGSLPNPLCGVVVGGCVPDDGSMACTTYVPPTLPNGDGGPLPNPPDNSASSRRGGRRR